MAVTLMRATAQDAPALLSMQKAAFQPLYELYQDEQSPYLRDEADILRWINHENVSYFCIYTDKTLCGGIAILNKGEDSYYLARIYIRPDFQGHGIAFEAIVQCEALFPQAKKWALDFPIDRIANKKTYEKAGYHDTGERETINDKLTLAIYEKIVSKRRN